MIFFMDSTMVFITIKLTIIWDMFGTLSSRIESEEAKPRIVNHGDRFVHFCQLVKFKL